MNFQLKVPSKQKKKKTKSSNQSLSTGLNQRGQGPSCSSTSSKPAKNVLLDAFGGGDSDDEEEDPHFNEGRRSDGNQQNSYRDNVNRAIQKEQAAMRKRAEQSMKKAMQNQQGTSIHDYDASYESFSSSRSIEREAKLSKTSKKDDDSKQSRYMVDLLKAAKERNYDRDIAYERKMARELEQEEEDNPELQGKDKFVTAGYKRRLEERQLWQQRRDQADAAEEEQDNKQNKPDNGGGSMMANFYGNFSRNVAMGGTTTASTSTETESAQADHHRPSSSMFEGFEPAHDDGGDGRRDDVDNTILQSTATPGPADSKDDNKNPVQLRIERRRLREEKVEQARERYFRRHGITTG